MPEGGVWKTISGRKVFIRNGQRLEEALQESWARREGYRYNPLILPRDEYARVIHELNTHYEAFKDETTIAWSIRNEVYYLEVKGFDEYNIFWKEELD